MADEEVDYTLKQHQLYLDERKQLVDAARESSRTFDKAVLTFGAAVFGASIAFLKDIAPHPAPDTLTWLGAAWLFFSLGSSAFCCPSCSATVPVYLKSIARPKR